MAQAPIKVGVIGAGNNTRVRHFPGLQAIDGVELVSVCNRSRESSQRVADQFHIPKVYDGRNKTFFMGAYEGIRSDTTSNSIISVPTALMRQGNFSEINRVIYDPQTGQPFPGNVIPPSRINPIAQKVLSQYPAANGPVAVEACVMRPGCSISDSTPPSDSPSVHSRVASQTCSAASSPAATRNDTIPP